MDIDKRKQLPIKLKVGKNLIEPTTSIEELLFSAGLRI